MVDNGRVFTEVWKEANIFLEKYSSQTVCVVTCGDWDLAKCLPNQLKLISAGKPVRSSPWSKWINIKQIFQNHKKLRANGMTQMLDVLGLPLIGRHHSGIDDVKNIVRICIELIKDGAIFPRVK